MKWSYVSGRWAAACRGIVQDGAKSIVINASVHHGDARVQLQHGMACDVVVLERLPNKRKQVPVWG